MPSFRRAVWIVGTFRSAVGVTPGDAGAREIFSLPRASRGFTTAYIRDCAFGNQGVVSGLCNDGTSGDGACRSPRTQTNS